MVIKEDNTAQVVSLKTPAFTIKQREQQRQVSVVLEIYKRRAYRETKLDDLMNEKESKDWVKWDIDEPLISDNSVLGFWIIIFILGYYLLFG